MKKTGITIVVLFALTLLLYACAPKENGAAPSVSDAITVEPSKSAASPELEGSNDPLAESGNMTKPNDNKSNDLLTDMPTQIPSVTPEESTMPTSPSTVSVSASDLYEKTYAIGGILIRYPQLTGMADTEAQEALNLIIEESALRDLGDYGRNVEYMLDSAITLNTQTVLSMYFDGYYNVAGSAHPNQFLKALTLDLNEQTEIQLSALVTVDNDFAELVLNAPYHSMYYNMTEDYASSIKEYLMNLGLDYWVGALQNTGDEYSEVSFFLMEDVLVISLMVPHVMGDHIEVYLPYEGLQNWQTDNPIWSGII